MRQGIGVIINSDGHRIRGGAGLRLCPFFSRSNRAAHLEWGPLAPIQAYTMSLFLLIIGLFLVSFVKSLFVGLLDSLQNQADEPDYFRVQWTRKR